MNVEEPSTDDFVVKVRGVRYELDTDDFGESLPSESTAPWVTIKLSVWMHGSGLRDVQVRCPSDITVGELATRIAQHSETVVARQNFGISSSRVGPLPSDLPIDQVDLFSGDEITIEETQSMQVAGRTVGLGDAVRLVINDDGRGGVVGREGGELKFNRPPRVAEPIDEPELQLPQPPSMKDRRPLQIALIIVPIVMGAVMALLWTPYMLLFMLMSPVIMISTWWSERSGDKKSFKRAQEEYEHEVAKFERDLHAALVAETRRRRADFPTVGQIAQRARERSPRLWERRPRDDDFLQLRVGMGRLASRVTVMQDRDPVPVGSHHLLTGRTIEDVPATVDLAQARVVGVHGGRGDVHSCARWLIAQAVCLHDPSELAVVAIVERAEEWEWLKWLPHVDARTVGLDELSVTGSADKANSLIRELRSTIHSRRESSQKGIRAIESSRSAFNGRWVLLLVDEHASFDEVDMARLLDDVGHEGTACIWMTDDQRSLPGQSGATIGLGRGGVQARLTDVHTGEVIDRVSPDLLGSGDALVIARRLAPIHVVQKDERAVGVPTYVTTADVNELRPLTSDALIRKWDEQRPGLISALGIEANGQMLVDLERDGPHGLVAGTTGSGKSEFLQNFVTGLAINHPPDRVSFLFVDYKGGSAFKDCIKFPHSVGMVTDLDEHLAARVLISLGAEIRRRERLLGEHRAKDLIELRRLVPESAVPSLMIVVDEFAALVSEVPEFVDGLVDIAQRGRSLGVHLILATQKPGGNVSPSIRANTNLRVALQTASEAESSDIIDAPDAARISRDIRGRAFVRLGHDELVEFQSAYTGGPAPTGSMARRRPTVEPFVVDGHRSRRSKVSTNSNLTELAAFADVLRQAARRISAGRIEAPWLPPLGSMIRLGDIAIDDSGETLAIGMVDSPEAQSQYPLELDLSEWGNALVFGAGGSGKTSILRTIAAALSASAPPSEIAIYGLDCAGRALNDIDVLPNVGSVIPGDDQERVERLIRVLRETIDRRGAEFAETGATDLESFRLVKAGERPEPRLILLLDSYAGFSDRYETVGLNPLSDQLSRIIADGPAVGVHTVATGDRRLAVPTSVTSIIPRKFVLQMATDDESMALGVDRDIIRGPKRPPGRAITEDGLELQFAILGEHPTRDSQALAVTQLGEELAVRWGAEKAPPIGVLPTELSADEITMAQRPWSAALGLDDATMQAAEVDLGYAHFAIAGPFRSGRSEALRTITHGLIRSTADLAVDLLLPRRSNLRDVPIRGVEVYGSITAIEDRLSELSALLETRSEQSEPILVVVDDGIELGEGASSNALEQILRRGIDTNIRVLAAFESSGMRVSFVPWIREVRKYKSGLLLDPDRDLDGDLFGVRLPRASAGRLPEGRGFLVQDGHAKLCQVALSA